MHHDSRTLSRPPRRQDNRQHQTFTPAVQRSPFDDLSTEAQTRVTIMAEIFKGLAYLKQLCKKHNRNYKALTITPHTDNATIDSLTAQRDELQNSICQLEALC